jgi:cold shock CspA family protein
VNGRVVAFDAHGGLGEIAADDGARYPFHCTQLVDGSRIIEIGAEVEFAVAPGPLGRWEAAAISRR